MKLALIGYGKMGHMIEDIARSRGHNIVSIIDIDNREDFDSDAFRSADVAIEFTSPASAYDNCMSAFRQDVKVVSGSTGWMSEHGEEMERLCREEGRTLFWHPISASVSPSSPQSTTIWPVSWTISPVTT